MLPKAEILDNFMLDLGSGGVFANKIKGSGYNVV